MRLIVVQGNARQKPIPHAGRGAVQGVHDVPHDVAPEAAGHGRPGPMGGLNTWWLP